MTAVPLDLYIEQGSTFTLGFTWYHADDADPDLPGDPWDLGGATARMQIRQRITSAVPLVDAKSDGTDPRITLGATPGRVDVVLTDIDTDALRVKDAVYDLEVVLPGAQGTHRLLQGAVTVSPNVTRVVG